MGSIRTGLSVGATTDSASMKDQIKKYKARDLPIAKKNRNKYREFKQGNLNNPSHESLAMKCVKAIVENFNRLPAGESVPTQYVKEITSRLSIDLDPRIAAWYVFDESYWKRRCVEHLGLAKCNISQHCLLWKQLFFENHIKETLQNYDKDTQSFEALMEDIRTYADYIFTLDFTQLPSHIDLSQVCAILPNLTKLAATYGVKKVGMKYERILFGMKISDASSLARAFLSSAPNLTTLILSRNLVDDDLLRMLMTGLSKSTSITALDLSHNRITNHGARLLSRMLLEKTVLTTLNLADNMIHAEGGRYLARGLRSNDSLMDLNLRLNRLTDLGGRMLLDGMVDNKALTRLNLSSNSLAKESVTALSTALKERSCPIQAIDLSCNNIEDEHLKEILSAMECNSSVMSLDLRMNKISEENDTLPRILEVTYSNELAQRSNR